MDERNMVGVEQSVGDGGGKGESGELADLHRHEWMRNSGVSEFEAEI